MKLVEIFSEFRKATDIVTNVITYPGTVIYQQARLIFQRKINEVELPIGNDNASEDKSKNNDRSIKEGGNKYKDLIFGNSKKTNKTSDSDSNQKFNSVTPQNSTLVNSKKDFVEEEEIPALTEGQEIRGRKGKYKCLGKIVREQKRSRVYEGIHIQTNKPVLIKEYLLLDREYNQKERRTCKKEFAEINKITFRKGKSQDFRIISPFEAISPPRENRCYLIIEPICNSITLKEYLEQNGTLTPRQVVNILDQVLQTLWFLDSNKVRLPSGQMQNGMAHGNLNLDTIYLVKNELSAAEEDSEFFTYVSDLAVWEHIFLPPSSPTIKTSFVKDSIDLGTVCFHLLSENIIDREKDSSLNLRDEMIWPYKDRTLEDFIRKLLRINGQLESPLYARQELLKLKENEEFEYQNSTSALEKLEEEENNKTTKLTVVIAGILLLGIAGLIGTGSYLIVSRIFAKQTSAYGNLPKENSILCCVDKVKIPDGKFIYVIDRSIWGNIFQRPGIVSPNKTLEEELQARQPDFKNYVIDNRKTNALEAVKNKEADFALTRWNEELPEGLEQKVVAYNGLVVFVAYSDEQREQNIPKALKGKISIERLRKLYSEGRRSWVSPRELEGWDIKLYLPFESSERELFEELLFERNNTRQINDYRNLVKTIISRQTQELKERNINNLNTRYLLEEISKDFEKERTIGIGFSSLSKVFGQCAVYPLAIQKGHQRFQPLVKTNGKPISPTTDLCNDKGGYWQNVDTFRTGQYPLGYSLVVVYPKDREGFSAGEQFVEMLRTQEGQYLLREAGLVPLQKLP
ncbi:MAG: hypothetical protein ACFBSE_02215 [Prochloraceae cyanobacterium]